MSLFLSATLFHSPGLSCEVTGPRIVVSFPPPDTDPELRRGQFAIEEEMPSTHDDALIVVDPPERLSSYRWNTRRLVIDIARQHGVRYDKAGRRHVVRAFPHPGRYRLVFADILETEPDSRASVECVVRVR